jgi:hypothetical protein
MKIEIGIGNNLDNTVKKVLRTDSCHIICNRL